MLQAGKRVKPWRHRRIRSKGAPGTYYPHPQSGAHFAYVLSDPTGTNNAYRFSPKEERLIGQMLELLGRLIDIRSMQPARKMHKGAHDVLRDRAGFYISPRGRHNNVRIPQITST